MTNPPIHRPALTTALFDFLVAGTGVLLGRGIAPPGGGWPQGNSRNGPWVDYAVLKTGQAVTPSPGLPERIGRVRTSWQVSYQITSHSTAESLSDILAQTLRAVVVTWDGDLTLDGVGWTLEEVDVPTLGPPERDDSTDPAHWRVTDAVSVRLSRDRTR